jgi:hypothetical protein
MNTPRIPLALSAALVMIAGCHASQKIVRPGQRSLAALTAGERAVVYYSTYSFQVVEHYAFTFSGSDPDHVVIAKLSAKNALDKVIEQSSIEVSGDDLDRIDSVLAFYRAGPAIGCRVEDHIETEWYRGETKAATEKAIDGSCALKENDAVLPFSALAERARQVKR